MTFVVGRERGKDITCLQSSGSEGRYLWTVRVHSTRYPIHEKLPSRYTDCIPYSFYIVIVIV
jgi:hypothetical protein